MVLKCILIMAGGALGAIARFGVSATANRVYGTGFPVGTLLVNLAGCFLIGLFFIMAEEKVITANMRLFLVTGFLGALTTFSTYAFESVAATRDGMTSVAILNLAANNVGGLLLVLAGMWLGRYVV